MRNAGLTDILWSERFWCSSDCNTEKLVSLELLIEINASYNFVFALNLLCELFVFQMNSESIQEGNQSIHIYF
jgi:hypothetical protein